jgi:hypothetical protein
VTDAAPVPPLSPALIPTAAAVQAAGAGLPADPIMAAQALVDKVFGPDPAVAVAATGELLRRSGLPLVSADGPVIAMPDGLALPNAAVDVEFLPGLTDTVRAGQAYSPDQVAAILQTAGSTTEALSGREVVQVLAGWGKGDPNAPVEVRSAGATVRALAAARHQLLVPSAIPDAATAAKLSADPASLPADVLAQQVAPGRLQGIDELQTLLLLAHATAESWYRTGAAGRPSGLRRTGAVVATAGAGFCDRFTSDEMKDLKKAEIKKTAQDFLKGTVKGMYGQAAVDKLSLALKGYDWSTDVLSTLLFITSVHSEIHAHHPGDSEESADTHFRHLKDDLDRDLAFSVSVTFRSPIPGKQLKCWNFAGVSVPPNGPMSGIGVDWNISQPEVLRPEPPGAWGIRSNPVHTTTNDKGSAALLTFPRREKDPPAKGDTDAAINHVSTTVTAWLSKHDFQVHLKDLVKLAAGWEAFFASEAWKLMNNLMQSAGIPNPMRTVRVDYHGYNAFRIQASTSVWLFPMAKFGMTADYYSCDGVKGPWKGSVVFVPSADVPLASLAKTFGYKGPTTGTLKAAPTFTLDPESAEPQKVPMVGNLVLVVQLDPDAITALDQQASQSGTYDRMRSVADVGQGSWALGDADLRQLKGMAFMTGMTFEVTGVVTEPRCPGSNLYLDPFDAY